MDKPSIVPGCLVKSKAGRDEGRLFLVIESLDENYVLLSDGDTRKVSRPKKKKLKHLRLKSLPDPDILKLLEQGIEDYQIRKWLAAKEESICPNQTL
ncbi:MAG: hypothetical protein IK019_05040 [Clostridia bacterium]|nr:hypothetical protein [Clostridia bacterium]MBR5985758.1 hypothetical protein [Clostridia bacterium]MBR6009003.1 hypothetical protein [Clostridia bacterium]